MRAVFAEAFATFSLVFIGAGAAAANVGTVGVALAHGLVLMSMIYAVGYLSGAHCNPAVTLAFLVSRSISIGKAAAYIAAQLIGATIAGLLLKYIYLTSPGSLGTPMLAAGLSFWGGVIIEAILTLFLVFVIFGAIDRRASPGMAGIAIGAVLSFDILMGGSLTGAAMNPARAFGPALASGLWQNQFVYWLGPIVGGLIAAVFHNLLFHKKK
ncbi:MAG TPA: aquaporin [Candidatus Nanoarchaeia archaeon]|nr:aquaporin [Candidatus Nanoarchaeia archaeon]